MKPLVSPEDYLHKDQVEEWFYLLFLMSPSLSNIYRVAFQHIPI